MQDIHVSSNEEFLTISIRLTEEEYEKRVKKNTWYSIRFMDSVTKWRYTTWKSIQKNSKSYITFQIFLLIISLAIVSITTYLLIKHIDELEWYKILFSCLYMLAVVVCSINYFKLFLEIRKRNYVLNETQTFDKLDNRFYVFVLIYSIFGILPVGYLEQSVSGNFQGISYVLLLIYGVLTELYIILYYGYCIAIIMFIFEFLIRLISCHLTCPCSMDCEYIVKKFPILKYNTQNFNENICKICHHDFENNDPICRLNCSVDHIFHEHCLKESIIQSAYGCPSCGANILPI